MLQVLWALELEQLGVVELALSLIVVLMFRAGLYVCWSNLPSSLNSERAKGSRYSEFSQSAERNQLSSVQ